MMGEEVHLHSFATYREGLGLETLETRLGIPSSGSKVGRRRRL